MPELPEVESIRRQLAPVLAGRVVVDVRFTPQRRFLDLDLLPGHRLGALTRRGKFLLAPLTGDGRSEPARELVAHLGMTGSFRVRPREPGRPDDRYTRATLLLDDGAELVFRDTRRFGRLAVVAAGQYTAVPTLAALGPEPLSDAFDTDAFAAALRRSSAPVKAVLLGQRAVAGLGNIYADEALWRARIHPGSRRVGPPRARTLHAAIREVLTAAIEREGTTFRDYQMVNGQSGRYADFLDAYGQATRPCRRCGTPLRHTVVAQRGTTYCPRCQRP